MPAIRQSRTHLFFPQRLIPPHLTSPRCIFVSPFLMLRLGYHLRHDQSMPILIDSDIGQISRRHMPQPILLHILHHSFDTHLHRRPVSAIHAGLQYQQISNSHRRNKIQVIHTCSHRNGSRMSRCSHRSDQIDVLHKPPAKQIPQSIRICGKNNLTPFRLRFRNRPFQNQIAHSYKSKSPTVSAFSAFVHRSQ